MAHAHKNHRGGIHGGFLQRATVAVILCILSGILLALPGISAEYTPPAASNHSLYSSWQTYAPQTDTSADTLKVGSFQITRPQSELFIGGLSDELGDILIGMAADDGDIENYLRNHIRARLIDDSAPPPDFRDWLLSRRDDISDKLFRTSTDYIVNYLNAAATGGKNRLSFIRNIEWDYQSELGERRWQTGLSALGALREGADDAVVWQLRAYAAQDSGKGANAGILYRRAVTAAGGALVGANVFLDYEQHGDADEDFWRWSIGGEFRNAHLDIYLNRYLAVTDSDNKDYYTQDGFDAQLNLNTPALTAGKLSGGITYYRWEGEYGDSDDEGLRYHLRFSPARGNLRLELELDSPEGGSTDWGGRVSYRHVLGAANSDGRSSSSGAAFDAGEYFFEPARREYAQRIRKKNNQQINDNRVNAVFRGTAPAARAEVIEVSDNGGTETRRASTLNAARPRATYSRQNTLEITTQPAAELILQNRDWIVEVREDTETQLVEKGKQMNLIRGNIYVDRTRGLDTLVAGPVTIDLIGTEVSLGWSGSMDDPATLLVEKGMVSIAIATTADLKVAPITSTSVTVIIPLPLGGQNVNAGCNSALQRDHQQFLNSDFDGCPGDVHISGIPEGERVYVRTGNGEELFLTGAADGSIEVLVDDSIASTWDRYPFDAGGRVSVEGALVYERALVYSTSKIAVSYQDDVTMDIAADSEVEFFRILPEIDYSSHFGITDLEVDDLIVAVRSGKISAINGDEGSSVSCAEDSLALVARNEGKVEVLAACGGYGFPGFENRHFISGTLGDESRLVTIAVSGGNGMYTFELQPLFGQPTFLTLPDEYRNGTEMVMRLDGSQAGSATYLIRAYPSEEHQRLFLIGFPEVPFLVVNVRINDGNEGVLTLRHRDIGTLPFHTHTHNGIYNRIIEVDIIDYFGFNHNPSLRRDTDVSVKYLGADPPEYSDHFMVGKTDDVHPDFVRYEITLHKDVTDTEDVFIDLEVEVADANSTITLTVHTRAYDPGQLEVTWKQYDSSLTNDNGHHIYIGPKAGDRFAQMLLQHIPRDDRGNRRFDIGHSSPTPGTTYQVIDAEGFTVEDVHGVPALLADDPPPSAGIHYVTVSVVNPHPKVKPVQEVFIVDIHGGLVATGMPPRLTLYNDYNGHFYTDRKAYVSGGTRSYLYCPVSSGSSPFSSIGGVDMIRHRLAGPARPVPAGTFAINYRVTDQYDRGRPSCVGELKDPITIGYTVVISEDIAYDPPLIRTEIDPSQTGAIATLTAVWVGDLSYALTRIDSAGAVPSLSLDANSGVLSLSDTLADKQVVTVEVVASVPAGDKNAIGFSPATATALITSSSGLKFVLPKDGIEYHGLVGEIYNFLEHVSGGSGNYTLSLVSEQSGERHFDPDTGILTQTSEYSGEAFLVAKIIVGVRDMETNYMATATLTITVTGIFPGEEDPPIISNDLDSRVSFQQAQTVIYTAAGGINNRRADVNLGVQNFAGCKRIDPADSYRRQRLCIGYGAGTIRLRALRA